MWVERNRQRASKRSSFVSSGLPTEHSRLVGVVQFIVIVECLIVILSVACCVEVSATHSSAGADETPTDVTAHACLENLPTFDPDSWRACFNNRSRGSTMQALYNAPNVGPLQFAGGTKAYSDIKSKALFLLPETQPRLYLFPFSVVGMIWQSAEAEDADQDKTTFGNENTWPTPLSTNLSYVREAWKMLDDVRRELEVDLAYFVGREMTYHLATTAGYVERLCAGATRLHFFVDMGRQIGYSKFDSSLQHRVIELVVDREDAWFEHQDQPSAVYVLVYVNILSARNQKNPFRTVAE